MHQNMSRLELCLFLRPPAPARGPQKSDQQQHRGGPLKPDVVEAAEQVDQKQEDDDGDHHGAETRQPYVPFPGARDEAGLRMIRGRRRWLRRHRGPRCCAAAAPRRLEGRDSPLPGWRRSSTAVGRGSRTRSIACCAPDHRPGRRSGFRPVRPAPAVAR